eukprot:scaffold2112_cov376-Prasinococcus_capsulatus_cf.AAC.1
MAPPQLGRTTPRSSVVPFARSWRLPPRRRRAPQGTRRCQGSRTWRRGAGRSCPAHPARPDAPQPPAQLPPSPCDLHTVLPSRT